WRGSGMEIAACADLRVAAEHARFGMPETRFGIPSGMEASLLPKLVGWGKAVELVLTGDVIDAREAHRVGYLQRIATSGELDATVERWLDSLLAGRPAAILSQKPLRIGGDRIATTDAPRDGSQAVVGPD